MESELEKELYTVTMYSKYNFKDNLIVTDISKDECNKIVECFEKGEPVVFNFPITKDKISNCIRTENYSWMQIKYQK